MSKVFWWQNNCNQRGTEILTVSELFSPLWKVKQKLKEKFFQNAKSCHFLVNQKKIEKKSFQKSFWFTFFWFFWFFMRIFFTRFGLLILFVECFFAKLKDFQKYYFLISTSIMGRMYRSRQVNRSLISKAEKS